MRYPAHEAKATWQEAKEGWYVGNDFWKLLRALTAPAWVIPVLIFAVMLAVSLPPLPCGPRNYS